jgi:PQQ-dependent catabolism-associated CXXCW motif protein
VSGSARCPYPGLRSFLREEADLFFGRESCIDRMVDKLGATRFLAVLGSSGSGKSSLVRTGLLEALDLGLLARAGVHWSVALMRPGDRPMFNLARSLLALSQSAAEPAPSRLDIEMLASFLTRGPRAVVEWCQDGHLQPGRNLLLLVDQFEELFRYGDYAGHEEAEAFVSLLLESSRAADVPIYVVMTMRSEFLGACALFPGLAERINEGLYLAPRMTRQEIREAIEGPAGVCGFSLEPALVNRLLNDLASFAPWEDEYRTDQTAMLSRRADQLPLMQHVLNRMWMQADAMGQGVPVRITLDEYERLGGLNGALDAHAREVLESLPGEERALVGTVFRALTGGPGVDTATRRPCRFGELVALAHGRRDSVLNIVNAFRALGCNFLTPPEGVPLEDTTIVDISHESLIRQWSDLRGWLRDEAQSAETYRHIEQTAELRSKKEAGLLRMPYLAVALAWRGREDPTAAWAARYGGDFPLAMRFLDASARSHARRRNLVAAVVGLFVIGSGGFGVVQFLQARSTETKLMTVQGNLQQLNGDLELAKAQLKDLNFANELTDFGVAPKPTLEADYGTKTPTTIPGGTVIFTKDLQQVLNSQPPPIMIDTLADDHATTIPSAHRIPFAGAAGDFDDEVQHRLAVRLDNLTNGDRSMALIFFCEGAVCWESYNASLRAMHAGYTRVYWYRGGLASWQAGGFHTQTGPQEARSLADNLTLAVTMAPKRRWALAVSLSESAQRLRAAQGSSYAGTAIDYAMLAYRELKALTAVMPDNADLWADFTAVSAQLWEQLKVENRMDAAKTVYDEMKLVLDMVAHARPENAVVRGTLAMAIEGAGDAFNQYHDADAALAWYLAARGAWAAPDGKPSATPSAQGHIAKIDRSVGWIRNGQKKYQDALDAFLAAVAIDRQRVADAPNGENSKTELSYDLFDAGYALEQLRRFGEALEKLSEARALVAADRKAKPDSTDLMVWTTFIDYEVGETLRGQDRLADAFVVFDDNIRLGRTILEKLPNDANAKTKMQASAGAVGGLSYQLALAGDFATALKAADDALEVMPDQVWIEANRAHALLFLGHPDEARGIYLRYRGQKINGDRTWDASLRADFTDLRKHGHASPVMDEVEAQLASAK